MPNRDLQRNGAAVAEAEKIGPGTCKVLKQPGHVVGRLLERDRLAAIGRASVPLLLERDDAAVAGQEREYPAEVRVDRRAAAVKEHERCPVMPAVHFVIDVDAVHRCSSHVVRIPYSSSRAPSTVGRRF
jgi:hypothetical protein